MFRASLLPLALSVAAAAEAATGDDVCIGPLCTGGDANDVGALDLLQRRHGKFVPVVPADPGALGWGARIPLHSIVALGNAENPFPPRLALELKVMQPNGTWSAPQQLLLDSGSSTLAFCDDGLGHSSFQTDMASCNHYGGDHCTKDCPGYVGWFYRGDVALGHGVVMPGAAYAAMTHQASMPCTNASGLFGIAHKSMDWGFSVPTNQSLMDLFHGGCHADKMDVPNPLLETIRAQSGPPLIGIHWSGELGRNEGTLYLGSEAVTNRHYDKASAMQVYSSNASYYGVLIGEVKYMPDPSNESFALRVPLQQFCYETGDCYVDTGAPQIQVPTALMADINEYKTGTLQFVMFPPGDAYRDLEVQSWPRLTFDVPTLLANTWLGNSSSEVVLGLPVLSQYYVMLNIAGGPTEFIPKH